MLRGLFVTGTDTGVGKTAVSAAMLVRYRPLGSVRYWKPIQTGTPRDDDTAEVRRLASCSETETLDIGIRLSNPVSPHLAAQQARETIRLRPLIASVVSRGGSERWIVEGAGGVLVPINDTEMMADLIGLLGLPALVVARSSLGTINHTLSTLEALRSRGLTVAGVVMVGDRNDDNRLAIEQYGRVGVVGEMPRFDRMAPEALAHWAATELDPKAQLLEWLQ
ncbi:MAG: dethiobiotin synthase [Vicinamibacterales bacterium]